MTISSTIRKAGPFTGNGSASAFPFYFKVFQASDLYVVKLTVATGVESTLTLTTDYTVSLNADQNSNPGGTVTLVAGALASGYTLTITSSIADLQPTDITNQGGFYPEVIEDALDRATIQIQQLQEQVDRSMKLPLSVPASVNPEMPQPVAGNLVVWNETATGLENIDKGTLATVISYGTAKADIFSGDGVTTVFILSANPGALANLDVSIGGVQQRPGIDYTWTGGTSFITFTSAPTAGTNNVLVRYMQGLAQGMSDAGSVEYSDSGTYGTNTVGYRLKQLFSSIGASFVQFMQSGTGAVARTVQSKLRDVVSVKDFGAVGDGVTDDTAALSAAFNYAIPLALPVMLEGTYRITGPIQPYATRASGGLHIVCKGNVTITVDSAATGFSDILYFGTTAYNNATITGGNLSIDGSNKAGRGITIRHDDASGGKVSITANLKLLNFLETDAAATRENQALSVFGRYTQVVIEQPFVQNVDRTNPAGATKGISVAALAGTCTINQPYVENVLCVSSANSDADGIAVFGYQAGGASSARQGTAVINEPIFINCQGRSFKGQIADVVVYRPRVKRTGAVVAIQQGADFDFQLSGEALLHEPVYEYYETGGVSPFSVAGSSFSSVVLQQTLDNREMSGRSVGGTMYTQAQLSRYASLIVGTTAKESVCAVNGLRVIPVGSFVSSAFSRAIVEFSAANAVIKSAKTKIEVTDVKGPVQCYAIGYTGYTAGDLTAKLNITAVNLTNTLGAASAARPFNNLSGSAILAVETFTFRNLNGFRDLMPSGWTFTFNQLQSGTSFTVDIATVVATGAPGWGASGYAFIECVGGGYFGTTDKNINVYKDNATVANTVFYTRDGGATWGTIK